MMNIYYSQLDDLIEGEIVDLLDEVEIVVEVENDEEDECCSEEDHRGQVEKEGEETTTGTAGSVTYFVRIIIDIFECLNFLLRGSQNTSEKNS